MNPKKELWSLRVRPKGTRAASLVEARTHAGACIERHLLVHGEPTPYSGGLRFSRFGRIGVQSG